MKSQLIFLRIITLGPQMAQIQVYLELLIDFSNSCLCGMMLCAFCKDMSLFSCNNSITGTLRRVLEKGKNSDIFH